MRNSVKGTSSGPGTAGEKLNIQSRSVMLRIASDEEIGSVMSHTPIRQQLADDAALAKLRAFNPQIFQSILSGERLLGLAAWLPLSEAGLCALVDGSLDAHAPDFSHLCSPGVIPAAAYCWYIHAPRRLARALPALLLQLGQLAPSVSVYARPIHAQAERVLVRLGFSPAPGDRSSSGALYHLPVAAFAEPESAGPRAKRAVSCQLAYTVEDLMKVFTIRAATYMHEQNCPYDEEFDGNDFCAAHFIGLIGDEPAGCIRVRFFAGFVKIERLAVRHEFRRSRLAFQLVRHAIAFARRKGYLTAYGHCAADLIPFWGRFGFKPIADKPPFAFSGILYHEMIAHLDAEPARIAIGQDPYVLVRPENRWDAPGPLDRSRSRQAVVAPAR